MGEFSTEVIGHKGKTVSKQKCIKTARTKFYIRLETSKVANNQNMENINLNLLVSCFISKL